MKEGFALLFAAVMQTVCMHLHTLAGVSLARNTHPVDVAAHMYIHTYRRQFVHERSHWRHNHMSGYYRQVVLLIRSVIPVAQLHSC